MRRKSEYTNAETGSDVQEQGHRHHGQWIRAYRPPGASPLVERRGWRSRIDTLNTCVSLTVSGPLIGS